MVTKIYIIQSQITLKLYLPSELEYFKPHCSNINVILILRFC